jgi:hypothetical protein
MKILSMLAGIVAGNKKYRVPANPVRFNGVYESSSYRQKREAAIRNLYRHK